MQRRTNDQIISQILETCQGGGATKTRIVYGCNLNFKNANSHIERLINAGLLEVSGKSYKITPKGLDALGHIVALRTLLGPAMNEEN